jgi:DNA-binding transcriptional ArsR family regulator
MARAKTEAFDRDLVRTAVLAKALAHPVRIRILEILGGRQTCICGGLVELLPLAQSTVSQHLKELRKAGLIKGEVDGPRTCYCLNKKVAAEALAALAGIFDCLKDSKKTAHKGRAAVVCRPCVTPSPTRRTAEGRTGLKNRNTRMTRKEKS